MHARRDARHVSVVAHQGPILGPQSIARPGARAHIRFARDVAFDRFLVGDGHVPRAADRGEGVEHGGQLGGGGRQGDVHGVEAQRPDRGVVHQR